MLTCPRCHWVVADARAQYCPNCGLQFQEGQASEGQASEGQTSVPPSYDAPPMYGAPQSTPMPPNYGAPPTYGAPPSYGAPPTYGAPNSVPMPPNYGAPPSYGAPPTYGAPPSMPMPPTYGAPPSMPMPPTYGAPPSMPMPPNQPMYGGGYGAQGGYPGAYYPGQGWRPAAQPANRSWGRILAAVIGILIVAAIVAGVIYNASRPQVAVNTPNGALSTQQAGAAVTPTDTPITTLLSDPLTSNANGWPVDSSHCYFGQDGYHISDGYICFAPIGTQTDGTESVTTKEVSGPLDHGYGLIFRRVHKGSYYDFVITSNGYFGLFKVVNDTITKLVPYTPSAAIKGGLNVKNSLSVTMKGSTFDCYVNGIRVTEGHDTSFTAGQWGLGVYSTDNVVFTDYLAHL